MTLAQAADSYLQVYLPIELRRDKGTVKFHRLFLRKIIQAYPTKEVDHFTLDDCREILRSKSEQNLSNRTLNHCIYRLKAFFDYCLIEGWVETNPATRMRPFKEEKRLVQALTKQELYQVINCRLPYKTAKRRLWARDRTLMMFLSSTGLRPAEVCGINWGDINFEEQYLTIRAEIGKGRKERKIYLINETASILFLQFEKLKPNLEDPVFLNRDYERFIPSGINRIFVKIVKYLGITRFKSPRVYLLRKSYLTYLIKDGVNIESVAALAGHSNPSITWKYYKEAASFDEIKKEVEEKFFLNHSPKSSSLSDYQKHLKKREGYVTKRDTFK